jgi:hypothetical protein
LQKQKEQNDPKNDGTSDRDREINYRDLSQLKLLGPEDEKEDRQAQSQQKADNSANVFAFISRGEIHSNTNKQQYPEASKSHPPELLKCEQRGPVILGTPPIRFGRLCR